MAEKRRSGVGEELLSQIREGGSQAGVLRRAVVGGRVGSGGELSNGGEEADRDEVA